MKLIARVQLADLTSIADADLDGHLEKEIAEYKGEISAELQAPEMPENWRPEPCPGCGGQGHISGEVVAIVLHTREAALFSICVNCAEVRRARLYPFLNARALERRLEKFANAFGTGQEEPVKVPGYTDGGNHGA